MLRVRGRRGSAVADFHLGRTLRPHELAFRLCHNSNVASMVVLLGCGRAWRAVRLIRRMCLFRFGAQPLAGEGAKTFLGVSPAVRS